jgi:uncharacterized membrane protein YeaQ/YmgE (transglycosylase-associated protein family)
LSLLAWIVLGLAAGFVASKIVNKSGKGFLLDIVLGVVGAVVGGWIFTIIGMTDVTGVNLYSFFVAIVGAIFTLVTYHLLVRSARWFFAKTRIVRRTGGEDRCKTARPSPHCMNAGRTASVSSNRPNVCCIRRQAHANTFKQRRADWARGMTVFERRGDWVIVLLSSGNLAGTQAEIGVLNQRSDLVGRDDLMFDPQLPMSGYRDTFGNWCTRVVAPKGRMRMSADAIVNDTGGARRDRAARATACGGGSARGNVAPPARKPVLRDRPPIRNGVEALRANAHRMGRVQTICDYVHHPIVLGYGAWHGRRWKPFATGPAFAAITHTSP